MGDILHFTGQTKGHIDPDVVLDGAKGIDEVIVIGVQKNGHIYVCGSDADVTRTAYLLAQAHRYMLELGDSDFD